MLWTSTVLIHVTGSDDSASRQTHKEERNVGDRSAKSRNLNSYNICADICG